MASTDLETHVGHGMVGWEEGRWYRLTATITPVGQEFVTRVILTHEGCAAPWFAAWHSPRGGRYPLDPTDLGRASVGIARHINGPAFDPSFALGVRIVLIAALVKATKTAGIEVAS